MHASKSSEQTPEDLFDSSLIAGQWSLASADLLKRNLQRKLKLPRGVRSRPNLAGCSRRSARSAGKDRRARDPEVGSVRYVKTFGPELDRYILVAPTLRTGLMTASWPICKLIPVIAAVLNPLNSASTW